MVTLKDITQFDDLLTELVAANVNYIHGIQFRTTELRQYRDQARALAALQRALARIKIHEEARLTGSFGRG